MGDYGIRISQDGKDVKTCSDKECVLTSKFSLLKGAKTGRATASYPEATEYKVTIAHGLNYIPFVVFRVDVADNGEFLMTPYYDSGALYEQYYYAYADSTNIYLVFYTDYTGSSTITTDYSYNIYLDKGKL